jgi:Protein kinase domain
VHADEQTERDAAARPAEGAADTLAGQAEDPTEHQVLTPSEEPTEFQPRPFSEQPTIALPDVIAPPRNEPPTVALPEAGIVLAPSEPAPVLLERTERTPVPPGEGEGPGVPPTGLDPPTVADRASATIKRAFPRRVPGYELLERLGAGTYGEVWLAQDERTGICVAIKFLSHDTDLEWQLIQAEVKQLALLHADPGIVQLLGVELERRPPYYIMAYAEQGSLANRLEKGPLPLAEALDFFRQLAEALAYVHAKGVRHCDMKPGNVLLKARKRALIADFGQAHLSSEQAPALGTFFYMAPEQATLAKQIPDTRWDVYGLGAIFYAMLTGQPPREDAAVREELAGTDDLSERLQKYRAAVEKAPRPDLHRGVAGMDRHLAEIMDRCLEVSPVRRLRDAGSILAALARRERLLRQRPLLVFGFLAQVILCLVLGGLGFLGVRLSIERTEEGLMQKLEPGDPSVALLVRHGMDDLRWHMIYVGVVITAAVTLVLSGLWGWLIWRLRHKERPDQGEGW